MMEGLGFRVQGLRLRIHDGGLSVEGLAFGFWVAGIVC